MISASGSLQTTPDNTMFGSMDTHMQMKSQSQSPASASSRILDIPCKVCGDFSSGKHYNIFACDGCAGFFKRSIRRSRHYSCKAKEVGKCIIDKVHRNQCRACRLKKCEDAGMNKDAVQHERGPRNSTLKKQQMNYMNEANSRMIITPPQQNVLNLTMGKPSEPQSSRLEPVFPFIYHPEALLYNNTVSFLRFPSPPTLPPTPPAGIPSIPTITVNDSSSLSDARSESAARLLFMNVQWACKIASFTALALSDQLLLFEDCWRELFILGAAQFFPLMDMAGGYFHRETPAISTFSREVKEFQDVLSKLHQLQLDPREFACLRAIVLFRTSFDLSDSPGKPELRELNERSKIRVIQEDSLATLNKYISETYPDQPLRFTKLMLILPAMRNVSSYTIEELFFRETIKNVPIVSIICDMYRKEYDLIFKPSLNNIAECRIIKNK